MFTTEFGPFFCPADGNFYLDFEWLDDLAANAPGDMGQAVIIAHEYAHWLQEKSGVGDYVRSFAGQDRRRAREMSVRYELQADCLAGVWGALARVELSINEEDLLEAAGVANHIGNDAAQRRAGYLADEATFTHGSSEQRVRWVRRGFQSGGDPSACDTFAPPYASL